MSTARHTPGPWTAQAWQCHAATSIMANGQQIAECSGFGKLSYDCLTDARLIAAAPELLESLIAIVKSLADQDDEGLIEHAQQMIDARAAIAKATALPLNEINGVAI